MEQQKKRANGSLRVSYKCTGKSKTRQSQMEQTQINNIINRYKDTGQFLHVKDNLPFYGDATVVDDYKTAMDAVNAANAVFSDLSSEIRTKFLNNPANLIKFLNDPKNIEESVKLGLREAIPYVNPKDNPKAAKAVKTQEKASSVESATKEA